MAAELIDPFDNPDYTPQPKAPQPMASPDMEILRDPFDDPNFDPNPPRTKAPVMVAPERSFNEQLRDTVMGEGRMQYPDVPDVGDLTLPNVPIAKKLRLSGALILATTPEQRRDILMAQLKDFSPVLSKDEQGNEIIEVDGERAYIAKPGLRASDLTQTVGQGVAYLAGATPAGAIASLPLRALAVGGLGAGTSVALDAAATTQGSEQGVSIPRAGTAFVFGAASEAAAPALSSIWRSLAGRRDFIKPDGVTLTRRGEAFLREAGIDPEQLTPDIRQTFGKVASGALDPQDAAQYIKGQSLPVPVRMTRGDVSMNADEQMFENLAEKGSYGEAARDIMRGARAEQREAIRANVPAIQDRIGGGSRRVMERGQGGQLAQNALGEARRVSKDAVDAAYQNARRNPAIIEKEGVETLLSDMRGRAQTYLRHAPEAAEELQRLSAMGADDVNGAINVEALFDWRRDVTNLYKAANSKTEAAAYKSMITSFDDNVQQVARDHLMAGNEEAARKWLRSINIRRGMGRRFEGKDLIQDLLEKEFAAGKARLKVAPEAASNYIFGVSNLGFVGKPQLAREMRRIRDRLGAQSEGWRALKEEAFMRFAGQLDGAMQGDARMVSGANFLKAWQDAYKKNPELMRVLFSETERDLITRFGEVASRVTTPVRGGENYSGTGPALANIGQRLVQWAGMGGKVAQIIGRIVDTARVGQNIGSMPVLMRGAPRGLGAAAAPVGTTVIDLEGR